jgi:hypothetical protein
MLKTFSQPYVTLEHTLDPLLTFVVIASASRSRFPGASCRRLKFGASTLP